LAKRGDKTLVVAGYRQPKEVHLAAMAMNELLGNVGSTLLLQKANPSGNGTIADLKLRFNDGDNLVVLGGDPAYNAPADIEWAKLAGRGRVIRQGYYIDQTAQGADAYIPAAHYLESWGDARTSDGTLVPVQPLIAPLFGGMTELEVLARIGGTESDPYKIVRKTFDGIAGSGDAKWEKFLHDGYLADSASAVESRGYDWDATRAAWEDGAKPVKVPGKRDYEVTFYRDHSMDDGRWCNNGWLLETPNPVTRIVWDNVLLMSYQTARELLGEEVAREELDFEELNKKSGGLPGRFGFKSDAGRFYQKVYKLEVNGKELEGPIWLLPGMADNVVGVALGYGRGLGRVGGVAGFNAYRARTSSGAHFAGGAKLTKKEPSATYEVACTQEQGIMDGRPVIREGNANDFVGHKDFVDHFDLDSTHHTTHIPKKGARYSWEKDQDEDLAASPYKKPFGGESNGPGKMDEERQQWGMVIDLGTCVGCDACVVACQSENNIPIVGKHQVAIGREMSWIRIDRYFSGDEHNPQVSYQGVACQHCEDAPCESVCPVNATVHDEEGLNLMAYNRCVGTRYCSNNCAYKVRRFNWFNYDFPAPLDQQLNTSITTRDVGVMEKCNFCIGRITDAKHQAQELGRDVQDGELVSACQQTCPTQAITFGNLADPESKVSKLAMRDEQDKRDRQYEVMPELNYKPAITYLKKVNTREVQGLHG